MRLFFLPTKVMNDHEHGPLIQEKVQLTHNTKLCKGSSSYCMFATCSLNRIHESRRASIFFTESVRSSAIQFSTRYDTVLESVGFKIQCHLVLCHPPWGQSCHNLAGLSESIKNLVLPSSQACWQHWWACFIVDLNVRCWMFLASTVSYWCSFSKCCLYVCFIMSLCD